MKRVLLLVLFSVMVAFPSAALAESLSFYRVNPLNEGWVPPPQAKAPSGKQSKAAAIECTSYNALVTAIRSQAELRNTSFSIHLVYDFVFSDLRAILNQAFYEAMGVDDYLYISYISYGYDASGFNGDVTINMTMVYATTYSEELYVSLKVPEILGLIITDGMTDYDKEKAIHDWIIRNVQYDDSRVNISAYDALFEGTTVCRGYALLFYKMLKSVGMDVRIVTGEGGGEPHAWNLVYVCGGWFHADATWDDPGTDDDTVRDLYFNLSDSEIAAADHVIDLPLEFYPALPAAPDSYVAGSCLPYDPPGSPPATPSLVSPASASTGISLSPTLVASAFSDPDATSTHLKTLWQISLNSAFTSIVYYDTSEVNLTEFTVPLSASLPDDSLLYWRVKYFDNDLNESEWSNVYTFITAVSSVPPLAPVLDYPTEGLSGVNLLATLKAEAFVDYDRWDVHLKTQWQVSSTADFSVLLFDVTSGTSLTSLPFTLDNPLPEFRKLYWRARYYDSSDTPSEWSETRSFTTVSKSSSYTGDDEDNSSGCFISTLSN